MKDLFTNYETEALAKKKWSVLLPWQSWFKGIEILPSNFSHNSYCHLVITLWFYDMWRLWNLRRSCVSGECEFSGKCHAIIIWVGTAGRETFSSVKPWTFATPLIHSLRSVHLSAHVSKWSCSFIFLQYISFLYQSTDRDLLKLPIFSERQPTPLPMQQCISVSFVDPI